jgi:type IV pilus assembly protein PilA
MQFEGDRPERESIHMKNRSNKKGAFTLIELLVVVLILAILTAVALPLYLSSVKDSEKKTCQTNMQTIANAVQAYKVRTRVANYPDIPDVSAEVGSGKILEDLNFAPQCPEDSTFKYTVTAVAPDGFKVTCQDPNHGRWENGAIFQTQ